MKCKVVAHALSNREQYKKDVEAVFQEIRNQSTLLNGVVNPLLLQGCAVFDPNINDVVLIQTIMYDVMPMPTGLVKNLERTSK